MSSSTARPCASARLRGPPRAAGAGRAAGAPAGDLSLLVQDEPAAPDSAGALPGEVDGLLGRRAGVGLAVAVDDGGLPGRAQGQGGDAAALGGEAGGGAAGGSGGPYWGLARDMA